MVPSTLPCRLQRLIPCMSTENVTSAGSKCSFSFHPQLISSVITEATLHLFGKLTASSGSIPNICLSALSLKAKWKTKAFTA